MYALTEGWLLTVLVALAALTIFVVVASSLTATLRLRATRFRCPWTGRTVTVRHLVGDDEMPTSVVSCSAFPEPMVLGCNTPCIERPDWRTLTAVEAGPTATHD
jgi:hypothetical protein